MENMQKLFSKQDLFLCICCYYLYLEIYVLFQNKETWLIPFNHHFVQARCWPIAAAAIGQNAPAQIGDWKESIIFICSEEHTPF